MTEEPTTCALPGCSATIEQPEDGGPPRRYCSPAHRAAARKQRHLAAHTEAEQVGPAAPAAPAALTAPTAAPAPAEAETLPPSRPFAKPWSAVASWLITPTPPPPPRPVRPPAENRSTARSAGERKRAAVLLRQRAVASIAVASLIAGGGGYLLTNTPAPVTPPQPPAAPQPTMDADQWASRAEVVLASINKQLDTVAVTEASWNRLPEAQRAGQPAALQALQERKALLEQQRTTLQSQIGAFRSLPDVTTDLTAAQAQLDAVERALSTASPETTSPDQAETIRTLAAQRDVHRQQRDYNSQELTALRSGVDEAVASPLPDGSDRTTPIAQQILALIEKRPDPRPRAETRQQALAIAPRRESTREERHTVSSTAPPDPSRPKAAGRSTTDLAVAQLDSRGADNRARGGATNVAASAVRTGGAVVRTTDNVVDNARQVLSGRSDSGSRSASDREPGSSRQSGSGDRSERVRPVSNVISTVTGSLLGRSDEGRSSSQSSASKQSSSAKQSSSSKQSGSSERSNPVGKADRSRSSDSGKRAGSSASRNDRHQESGRSTGGKQQQKESTPRGKAERIKHRAGAALGNGGRLLDPAPERGGSAEGRSGSDSARTGLGRTAAKGEGRATGTRNNADTGTTPGKATGSTGRVKTPAKGSSSSKSGGSTAGGKKSSTTTSPGTKTARNKKSTRTGPGSSGNTAKRSTSGGNKSDTGKARSDGSGGSSKSGGAATKKSSSAKG
jgi:hypothetical protein